MSGAVVWLTGRPSAGKSTLAARIVAALGARGVASALLDGDAVRAAIVPAPGYDDAARAAFYATLGRLAALLEGQGLAVVVAATAHRRAYRDDARRAARRFVEVFVDVPASTCAARDAKGLYAAVAAGRVRGVPGADAAYEPPERPDVVARGGLDDDAVEAVVALVEGRPRARG